MNNIELHTQNLPAFFFTMPDEDIDKLSLAIMQKQSQMPDNVLRDFPIVADLSNLQYPNRQWLTKLRECFASYQLHLIGVSNCNTAIQSIYDAGLMDIVFSGRKIEKKETLRLQDVDQIANENPFTASANKENTLEKLHSYNEKKEPSEEKNVVIRGNIRSGQVVRSEYGDLTIIGTVGAGAELIAAGNVQVFGHLRGRVAAGAKGDTNCFIYASQFNAQLVSIAGIYQTQEQLDIHKDKKDYLISLNRDETMRFETCI